jgi:methionine-rich copper-binding protein CopC
MSQLYAVRTSVLLGVLAGLTTVLLGAGAASAHDGLVRVVPADGATVQTAPSRVRLVFDEEVDSPSTVVVTGPGGTAVQTGPAVGVADTVSVPVRVTSPGTYHVAFRVVSADGHPVSGETTFAFRQAGATSGTDAVAPPADHRNDARAEGADAGFFSGGRGIGIVAGVALLAGLALLTVRRLPGGLVDPRGKGSP